MRAQKREAPRDYIDRESHYLWGKRYLLTVIERDAAPTIDLQHKRIVLGVRPGTSTERPEELLDAWYREQLKMAFPPLLKTVGSIDERESLQGFCAANENQMGKLQPQQPRHSAEHRSSKEAARMSGIHHRSRAGSFD